MAADQAGPTNRKLATYKLRLMELIKEEKDVSRKNILRNALWCKDTDHVDVIACYVENQQADGMTYDDMLEELGFINSQ